MRASRLPVVSLLAILAGAPLDAQTITTAGDFSVEPPTLFRWASTGRSPAMTTATRRSI